MRRALFIAIIALAAVSCNDSGGNNSTTDSTVTGTDTITNRNNTTETPLNDTTMNNMGSGTTNSPGSTGNGNGTDSTRH